MSYIKVQKLDDVLYEKIFEIIDASHNSVVPPLSERYTFQNNPSEITTQYMKDKFEGQNCDFVCLYNDSLDLLGFTAIKPKMIWEYLYNGESHSFECAYITLTIVSPNFRQQGVANKLYTYIDSVYMPNHFVKTLVRCTWSTNLNQRHLYSKFGYAPFNTIFDDRGIGIDTISFKKDFT